MLNYTDVGATGTCNGFPIFELKADGNSGESGPLNPCLIGKGNVFRIEITELGDNPALTFGIQGASEGDVVSTSDGEEIDLSGELPIVIEKTFGSTQDGFADLLNAAQPSDADAMTAFAKKVRDTINGKNVEEIAVLLIAKFKTLFAAMGMPVDGANDQAFGMAEELAAKGIAVDDADIAPAPCCDNKLWLLKRQDGKDLIYIEEDGGSMSIELTAALTADGPAIVL
jgi:hypothetical protein